ncbi:MAG: hypothetical protein PHI53_00635 [Candidatus Pacebacteria bacterium]|nr:hypothetical protein [Candidatus Paceibacterota bacterium]
MSRTSLFLPLTSLFAAILYCIFLQEYEHLSFLAILGFIFHLVAIWLFKIGQNKGNREKDNAYGKWLLLTTILVIDNALIYFFIKLLSFDIPKIHFLVFWYSGCLFYFSLTFIFKKEGQIEPLRKKLFLLIPLISLLTIFNLLCQYWAFQLNSGTTTVSFIALNSTFVPVVVGWIVFKEGKNISKIEIIGFLCGIAAAILIITSY